MFDPDVNIIDEDELRDWSEDWDDTLCAICGRGADCPCYIYPEEDPPPPPNEEDSGVS